MTTQNMINTPRPFAIAAGGTGVASVTIAPTATSWAGWDANSNMSANNFLEGYATTATAAATTTLTVSSPAQQFFTGSTTQTVLMPVASTLVLGQTWRIVNNSTGAVTIQSSGANDIIVLSASSESFVTCILTSGTTAASWSASPIISGGANAPVNTNITSMTGLTGVLQAPTGITSSAGLNLLSFNYIASAVNYFRFYNNITTASPIIDVTGSDASVNMQLQTKNGNFLLVDSTHTIAPALYFANAANTFYTGFKVATAQASTVTFTLPSADAAGFMISDGSANLSLSGTPSDISGSVTITGFSAFSTQIVRSLVIGKMVFLELDIIGTSNATTFTITGLPKAALRNINQVVLVTNAGVNVFGLFQINATSTTASVFTSAIGGSFTNTSTKSLYYQFWYEST